ncbi:PPOX class F420-dependent oxidoreductase [Cnuibacter sp. UC19_7]|uniref:PPOX class F420-dependent oxidoreductase n=1 Tax=Cnuibacter sp. UC19_7 TaxID=3350166 RepID=UPI003671E101
MTALPTDLVSLLQRRALCNIATVMPSGSPQVTLTWVDTDGENVLVNSVMTHQKVRNIQRDPRVAVTISDPEDPWFYYQVRGTVRELVTDGAADHIEQLSQKYTGGPYPWYGGRDQQRVILVIEPERVSSPR